MHPRQENYTYVVITHCLKKTPYRFLQMLTGALRVDLKVTLMKKIDAKGGHLNPRLALAPEG